MTELQQIKTKPHHAERESEKTGILQIQFMEPQKRAKICVA